MLSFAFKMPEICILPQEKHSPNSLSVILGFMSDLWIIFTFSFSIRYFLSLHRELEGIVVTSHTGSRDAAAAEKIHNKTSIVRMLSTRTSSN